MAEEAKICKKLDRLSLVYRCLRSCYAIAAVGITVRGFVLCNYFSIAILIVGVLAGLSTVAADAYVLIPRRRIINDKLRNWILVGLELLAMSLAAATFGFLHGIPPGLLAAYVYYIQNVSSGDVDCSLPYYEDYCGLYYYSSYSSSTIYNSEALASMTAYWRIWHIIAGVAMGLNLLGLLQSLMYLMGGAGSCPEMKAVKEKKEKMREQERFKEETARKAQWIQDEAEERVKDLYVVAPCCCSVCKSGNGKKFCSGGELRQNLNGLARSQQKIEEMKKTFDKLYPPSHLEV